MYLHFDEICYHCSMLNKLRQHQKLIESALDDFSSHNGQWQLWSDYHQRQMLYFQNEKMMYVWLMIGCGLACVMSLLTALVSGNVWAWGLVFVTGLAKAAVVYYLSLYNQILTRLENLTIILNEHAISLTTKPMATVLNHFFDTVSETWAKKIKKIKGEI